MEIIGIEFENWYTVILSLNWFAVVISVIVIFALIWLFKNHFIKKHIIVDEINLGIGDNSIKLSYDKKDQEIAYKIWVELSTRKIGLMFDKEHDVITEVYNSWYEFFKITRDLMKEVPASRIPYSNDLIELTEKILNAGLRPHLTIWQAKYRKWYENELDNNTDDTPQKLQQRYPLYDELIDDLIVTNKRMIEYKILMKKIAFGDN